MSNKVEVIESDEIVKVKLNKATGELVPITTTEIVENNPEVLKRALQVNTGVMEGLNVEQEIRAQQALSNFIKNVFVPGKHYGTIPGTTSKFLAQPGADLLEIVYKKFFENARTRYEVVEKELLFDQHYISYEYKCILSVNGNDIAEAVAGCNSMENSKRLVFQDYKPDTDEWVNKKGKSVFDVKDTVNQIAQKRAHNRLWRKVFGITAEFTDESAVEQLNGTKATKDNIMEVWSSLYIYETGELGKNKDARRAFLKLNVLKPICDELEISASFTKWKADDTDNIIKLLNEKEKVYKLIEEALNENKK